MTYNRSFTRITRRVQLVKQVLITLPEQLSSQPSFQLDSCCLILNFLWFFLSVTAFRFVFFFWPLYVLSIVELRLLIASLVSSHFSEWEKKTDTTIWLVNPVSGNPNTSQNKTSTLVSGVCFMVRSKRLNRSKGPSWSWSIVVWFITTCAITAYHHWSCEFEPRGVLDTILCDKSLSVTCDMSVVFFGYSGFLHQ